MLLWSETFVSLWPGALRVVRHQLQSEYADDPFLELHLRAAALSSSALVLQTSRGSLRDGPSFVASPSS